MSIRASLLNLLVPLLVITGVHGDLQFNFDNQCSDTLYLSSSPSDGDLDPTLSVGSLELFSMVDPFQGSIWVRTKCTLNTATGNYSCETGDCGSGKLACQGPPPTYPVTLLNFDINNNVVAYEVSLIHGHNVPVRIAPTGGSLVEGGSGACPVVACIAKIANVCPSNLIATNKDGAYVGCKSACDVEGDCMPTNDTTQKIKKLCNLAHVFPGDNSPPIYKCSGAKSYNITFCPPT